MMKKFLTLTAALALTACTTVTPTPTPTPTTPDETLSTFEDTTSGLSLKYSKDWSLTTSENAYNEFLDATKGEAVLALLQLPSAAYPGTNFGDADFGVSTVPTDSLEACLAYTGPSAYADIDSTQSTTVNGVTYYTGATNGAGAGNFYDSKIFRTYRGANCISIMETVHTMNIGNYEPGAVTEVDAEEVWARLDAIMQTVSFN